MVSRDEWANTRSINLFNYHMGALVEKGVRWGASREALEKLTYEDFKTWFSKHYNHESDELLVDCCNLFVTIGLYVREFVYHQTPIHLASVEDEEPW